MINKFDHKYIKINYKNILDAYCNGIFPMAENIDSSDVFWVKPKNRGVINPYKINIRRKLKRNVYDHEKAQKLWMYLIDDAAKEYVKEFGSQQDDVADMFPKETREQVARVISDRELENIKQGEYDVPQGTVS